MFTKKECLENFLGHNWHHYSGTDLTGRENSTLFMKDKNIDMDVDLVITLHTVRQCTNCGTCEVLTMKWEEIELKPKTKEELNTFKEAYLDKLKTIEKEIAKTNEPKGE